MLHLFTAIATHHKSAAARSLPWLAFLSAADQAECLAELANAALAAATTDRPDLLRDALYAWEATALAAWDDQNRHGQPGYDVEAPIDVERPA